MRIIVMAALVMAACLQPAKAWWRYAQWDMTESQLQSASGGQAVPCRPGVAVCATPPNGAAPKFYIEKLTMVGMPASASFWFDGQRGLNQTLILFPDTNFDLISGLLQGIHGPPIENQTGGPLTRVWRDDRRGSIITATPSGQGVTLVYRPATGSR